MQLQILQQTNVMLKQELDCMVDKWEELKGEVTRRRSFSSESGSADSGSDCDSSSTDSSPEMCRHFLKGRCRYKGLCKFSHDIVQCPYCGIDLPVAKVAASTHLSRCYKAHFKMPGVEDMHIIIEGQHSVSQLIDQTSIPAECLWS